MEPKPTWMEIVTPQLLLHMQLMWNRKWSRPLLRPSPLEKLLCSTSTLINNRDVNRNDLSVCVMCYVTNIYLTWHRAHLCSILSASCFWHNLVYILCCASEAFPRSSSFFQFVQITSCIIVQKFSLCYCYISYFDLPNFTTIIND